MQNTWVTIPLLLFVLACGAKQTLAQEAAQQEAIRKLETRMDELKSQMADIQSQLQAIRGEKAPATGSITTTPSAPPAQISPEEQEPAAGRATSDHETFAHDEEDAPRIYNAPLEPDYPGFFHLAGHPHHPAYRRIGKNRFHI